MQIIKNLWNSTTANIRDIIGTLLIIGAILCVTNIVAEVSDKIGVNLDLTRDFVFALGKFAAVALCGVGYLTQVTFHDSLGKFDSDGFMSAWESLTQGEKLGWFFKVSIAGIIAAALVFSIGV
jgi:hypothetical protein